MTDTHKCGEQFEIRWKFSEGDENKEQDSINTVWKKNIYWEDRQLHIKLGSELGLL